MCNMTDSSLAPVPGRWRPIKCATASCMCAQARTHATLTLGCAGVLARCEVAGKLRLRRAVKAARLQVCGDAAVGHAQERERLAHHLHQAAEHIKYRVPPT